ncbi:MAG: DUF4388 domain-containing protein [Deltaproteobacteria bacterium]|nr:DUF4388 domain-containing protein [Deltaproteobacteria bacterium]
MSPGRTGAPPSALLPLPSAAAARLQIEADHLSLAPGAPGEPVLLLGDLEASSVPELLTMINSGHRTGELVIQHEGVCKRLTFVEGEAVAVGSNVDEDRVGEVMWRQGLITLDQLKAACQKLDQGKRLGRLLIDSGAIDTRQLYNGLRDQVREVFLSVFLFPRGVFLFYGHVSPSLLPIKLEERTEKLIMDGVLQLDQVTQLRRKIGPPGTEVAATAATPGPLSEIESAMLQLVVDAQRAMPVRQVIDGCRAGELKGLQSLARLLEQGLVERTVEPATPTPARQAEDPIAPLVQAINVVVGALSDAGFGADEEVRTYLVDIRVGDRPLLDADQTARPLDAAEVRRRMADLGIDPEPVALLLDDALSFCLFQLRETLPPERALELTEQITEMIVR